MNKAKFFYNFQENQLDSEVKRMVLDKETLERTQRNLQNISMETLKLLAQALGIQQIYLLTKAELISCLLEKIGAQN
ncbi:MAG: hypothetical protein ACFFCQ_04990 [Promethearchaeota archaeon]